MHGSHRKGLVLAASVLVLLALSAIAPVHAEYHKAYRFKLPGDWIPEDVVAVRVITNAMEVVTDQYCGWLNPWGQGTVGYPIIGGLYNTRIAYRGLRPDFPTEDPTDPGVYWEWDDAIKLGWSVSDSDCRLRDLKWVKEDDTTADVGILNEGGSLPGGGELLWDPPEWPGKWVWRIHNDPPTDPEEPLEPIPVHNLEMGVFEAPLAPEEIAEITEEGAGIFEKRAGDIDGDLAALRQAVLDHDIPAGWVNSLTGKIDSAVADKLAGDMAYQPPNFDIDSALHFWGQAAQHLRTFESQVRNDGEAIGRKWEVPAEWADWADAIADAILVLPGAQPPAVATPSTELTALAAAAPPIDIPADLEIPPGGYVDIVLDNVAPGDAVVLNGDVTDGEGNTLVEWAEQVVIPEELIPPSPPTISPAPDEQGYLYYPGFVTLDAADDDTQYICWWIGEPGEEPTALRRDLPPIEITIEDEGLYKLVYLAEDHCGNISTAHEVTIERGQWITMGGPVNIGPGWPWYPTIDVPICMYGADFQAYNYFPVLEPKTQPVVSYDLTGHRACTVHFIHFVGGQPNFDTGTQIGLIRVFFADGGVAGGYPMILGVNTAAWTYHYPGYTAPYPLPEWATKIWVDWGPNGQWYPMYHFYGAISVDPTRELGRIEVSAVDPRDYYTARVGAVTLELP